MGIAQIIYLRHNQGWGESHIYRRRLQSAPYPQYNQLFAALGRVAT